MGFAVTIEGRSDPGGIVLLIEDQREAESIAREIRSRGPRVVVTRYQGRWNESRPSNRRRESSSDADLG